MVMLIESLLPDRNHRLRGQAKPGLNTKTELNFKSPSGIIRFSRWGVFMRWPIWFVAISLSFAFSSAAARADDYTDCFSVGTKSYADPSFYQTGLDACTRLIRVRSGKQLAETYSARASWLHKQNKDDAALADYDKALSIDSTNVEFYDYRGDSLIAKGELDAAIANYNQAIRIDPTYAAAYYSRGKAYQAKGDIERARESYQAALVPPLTRKLKMQERIQEWAQTNATKRLEELNAPAPAQSGSAPAQSGK
jgi:tetratricopeptide (TPR) repeat protein